MHPYQRAIQTCSRIPAVVLLCVAIFITPMAQGQQSNRATRVLPTNVRNQRIAPAVPREPIRQAQRQQDANDRPTSIEEITNSDRPQNLPPATEPININFDEDIPIKALISAIGAQTGRNFNVHPNLVNQKVTIYAHHPVPAELALAILESILAQHNFRMVETLDGNLINIVPLSGLEGVDKFDINVGNTAPTTGFDRQIIQVASVKYADVSEVADLLSKVGSQNSSITPYLQTNTLIIRDSTDGVRNMLQLLELVDIPGSGTSVEFFTLEYARAEALAKQIQDVLIPDGQGRSGAGGQPQRPVTVRRQPRPNPIPGQPTVDVIGADEQILRMVSDERLNSLIVVASESLMEQVRFLIARLDSPTPSESNNMHYVELLNADAVDVVEALTAITGSGTARASNQQGGQTADVQPFEKNIVITAYEPTNALFVLATPQDFKVLEALITRIDVPRRQVSVEAVIMEVTINDTLSLTVEGAGLTSSDVFALSNATNIANALVGGPLSLAGPGGTLGIIDGTIDITDPLTGDTISIPNVPLLMKALEQITDVDVLSRPNLLTVDNELARINVGQEIPLISSLGDTDDRTGFNSRSQIQRTDTGVTLEVTPLIREGDFVSLEVLVDVSTPIESDIGIDPNTVGATIAQAVLETNVIIEDGKTGIIGGLLRESISRSVSQVPFLGDLPLVGWLFRGKSNARRKQNLVVLLTPHIIRQGSELQEVTEKQVAKFYNQNVDAIFERGFITRVSKKRKQRKSHPTQNFRAELEGRDTTEEPDDPR